MTRLALPLALAFLLPACATYEDAPIYSGPLAAEGSAVALGQAVALGAVVVTPMEVIEDSRCPMNARCVWAGRVVLKTRIDGAGWRETVNLELGEAQQVRDHRVMLASAEPNAMAGQEIEKADYRFAFEGDGTSASTN